MDATVIRSSPRRLTRSFALWLGTIVLGVVALGWLGISRFAAWRYDRELTRAEHEIDSGDFAQCAVKRTFFQFMQREMRVAGSQSDEVTLLNTLASGFKTAGYSFPWLVQQVVSLPDYKRAR